MSVDGGFWRLSHDDLEAVLSRGDLCWELARVYLALGDLTFGFGKGKDTVSISQIAERAGMYSANADGTRCPDCPHVCRALKRLAEIGLCGAAAGKGQNKTRWVVFPPPAMPTTAEAGTTAKAGSRTTADAGNVTTAIATAKAGRHQDSKKEDHKKSAKKSASAKPPPDPRVRQFINWFSGEFKAALGCAYVVTGGKDGATVKRLLSVLDGQCTDALAELQKAARNMLSDLWGKERASIGLLSSQVNTWRAKPAAQRRSTHDYRNGF